MLKFDLPKNQSSIIKVIGIGGGGSNAVNHMFEQGIQGVDFIICNTDNQALESSPIPTKIQLGTKGLGAGSIPDVGRESAQENIEDIRQLLEKNTKMLFITAGMGGGTGTGAAPVIAQVAKEMGILTVGIVTLPFSFEGRKRKLQADAGIQELRQQVDSLLIICNDKLREVHGDLKLSEAFQKADSILSVAAKGIAEIITVTGYINVDFEDVRTVMQNSGTAIMGSATAEGENRAIKAVEEALSSPLLNDNQINGSNNILLYLSSGAEELTMDEVTEITDYIQDSAGQNAEIIWGNGIDESLGNNISITLVATGFDNDLRSPEIRETERKVHTLTVGPKEERVKPTPITTEPITEITLLKPTTEPTENKTEADPDARNETNNPDNIARQATPLVEKVEASIDTSEEEVEFKTYTRPQSENRVNKPVTLFENQSETEQMEPDLIERRSKERIKKLKDLSMKLHSPQEIDHMEKTPAYLRRNVELNEVKPSSESEISRFTLGEGTEGSGDLKTNNAFLHKTVD